MVALDEVAVVAIHRADEVADAFLNERMEAACEGIAPGDEIGRKVGQVLAFLREKRLHGGGSGHLLPLSVPMILSIYQ